MARRSQSHRLEPHQGQGQALIDAGMLWADTPRAVAEASDIVFSIVTDGAAVRAVALGDDGVISPA